MAGYEYHHSRGHEVVEALLGPDFQGVLGSDFYAAYAWAPGWLRDSILSCNVWLCFPSKTLEDKSEQFLFVEELDKLTITGYRFINIAFA
jgi:hypothetical protein